MIWTAADVELIRAGKHTTAEIAALTNHTYGSVQWKRRSLGIKPFQPLKYWTDERKKIVRRGYDSNLPAREIAAQIGNDCTRGMVIGAGYRMGLQHPYKIRKEERMTILLYNQPFVSGYDDGNLTLIRGNQTPAANRCQYPDGESPDWNFCGAEQKLESSYCEEHHKLCYRQTDYKPATFIKLWYR